MSNGFGQSCEIWERLYGSLNCWFGRPKQYESSRQMCKPSGEGNVFLWFYFYIYDQSDYSLKKAIRWLDDSSTVIINHISSSMYRERNGGGQWWFFQLICNAIIQSVFLFGRQCPMTIILMIYAIMVGHIFSHRLWPWLNTWTHLANGGFRIWCWCRLDRLSFTVAAAIACGISSLF